MRRWFLLVTKVFYYRDCSREKYTSKSELWESNSQILFSIAWQCWCSRFYLQNTGRAIDLFLVFIMGRGHGIIEGHASPLMRRGRGSKVIWRREGRSGVLILVAVVFFIRGGGRGWWKLVRIVGVFLRSSWVGQCSDMVRVNSCRSTGSLPNL